MRFDPTLLTPRNHRSHCKKAAAYTRILFGRSTRSIQGGGMRLAYLKAGGPLSGWYCTMGGWTARPRGVVLDQSSDVPRAGAPDRAPANTRGYSGLVPLPRK